MHWIPIFYIVSGSLSAHHQEFLAMHWLWYILCSCDEPFATRSRMELLCRRTEFQFYWYYDSYMFRAAFLPIIRSSYLYIGFGTFYAVVTICCLLLVANGSSQLHKMYQSRCTAKNSWWWAEWLPETCRVIIPIKLEFSASVGFIHKESVTMHGHSIVKFPNWFYCTIRLC